jgi:hypothetical protein
VMGDCGNRAASRGLIPSMCFANGVVQIAGNVIGQYGLNPTRRTGGFLHSNHRVRLSWSV